MELKQLEFFVTCAQAQSFRKAASLLFTTQSNVSKVIRSLEEELGVNLFDRKQSGVTLTAAGSKIYEYACSTLENADRIKDFSALSVGYELRILTNPSSWLASIFRQYYNLHFDPDTRYSFYTHGTSEIIREISTSRAQLGFIYIMEQQLAHLQIYLRKNQLTFIPLTRTNAVIYQGKGQGPMPSKDGQVHLIQGYDDEFTLRSYWSDLQQANDQLDFKVTVSTNSDYLMNEMLENSNLGNISGGYLSQEEKALRAPARSLYPGEAPVIFGCICPSEEALGKKEAHFLDFTRQALENKNK